MGLARGGVTEQGPVSTIILVTDDKVEGCEHGEEKSLELQESMTLVGGPFGGTELGPLGLGREGEGLVLGGHSRRPSPCNRVEKKKEEVRTSRANWRNSMQWTGPATLGVVDAGGRSGPRWTSDA